MKPRERARARLQRRTPSATLRSDREPSVRLAERQADSRPEHRSPGDTVRIPSETKLRALRSADVGPNAPLLIRLVRHPFALQTARPNRVDSGRHADPADRSREPYPEVLNEARELLGSLRDPEGFHGPLDGLVDRPEHRPHPFRRLRLAKREEP